MSVEVNIAGERGWKFAQSLDNPLTGPRGVTVMSKFYLIGIKGYNYLLKIEYICYKVVMLVVMVQVLFKFMKTMYGELSNS